MKKKGKAKNKELNFFYLILGLLIVLAFLTVGYFLIFGGQNFSTEKILPIPTVSLLLEKKRTPAILANLISLAKADLVKKIGVKESLIKVSSSLDKDWPDTSLGCPKPGMVYAQVITPGYLITLEAKAKKYFYHTDLEKVISCAK